MLQNIIQHIQERLQTIPGIRYIDEDWGQLSYDIPPVQFPCALIDVDGFQYSQMGALYQQGEGTVSVTISDMKLEKTSANVSDKQKQAAGAFFALLKEVHYALHGTAPQGCTPLIRTSLKRVRRDNNIREFAFVFKISYVESPGQENLTEIYGVQISIQ